MKKENFCHSVISGLVALLLSTLSNNIPPQKNCFTFKYNKWNSYDQFKEYGNHLRKNNFRLGIFLYG